MQKFVLFLATMEPFSNWKTSSFVVGGAYFEISISRDKVSVLLLKVQDAKSLSKIELMYFFITIQFSYFYDIIKFLGFCYSCTANFI